MLRDLTPRLPGWLAFWRRIFTKAAVLLLALIVVMHFTPLVPWYGRLLAGDWTDASGDVLIVLSSDIQPDGALGESSYLRCLYAIRAYREHPFRAIVLSGGTMPNAPQSMAATMRDFLAASGVPREILHVEERSRNTRENALYTAALIHDWPGRKVLLTSDYHMFRARRAFAKAGLVTTPRPIPDALKRFNRYVQRWPCFWTLVLETGKIGYYRARGWI